MRKVQITLATLLCLSAIVTIGCGPDTSDLPKTVNASGVLTLDGKPVDKATVVFIADSGTYHSTATTDANGKFSLRAFPEKEGAVPGNYKIEATKSEQKAAGGSEDEGFGVMLTHALPQKYSTFATSGLTFTIPESGTSDIKLELKSK